MVHIAPKSVQNLRSRLLTSTSARFFGRGETAALPGSRGEAPPTRKAARGQRRRTLHVETLEPRLLLSADLLPGLDPAALTAPATSSAESIGALLNAPAAAAPPAIVRSVQEVLDSGTTTMPAAMTAETVDGTGAVDTSVLHSAPAMASLVLGPTVKPQFAPNDPTSTALLIQGVDNILNSMKTAVQAGNALGNGLPLIGDGLKSTADFIDGIKTAFDTAVSGLPGTGAALSAFRSAVATAFGVNSANVVLEINIGAGKVVWNGTDLTPAEAAALSDIEFKFDFSKTVDLLALDFDLNKALPGLQLGIEAGAKIDAHVGYSAVFDFGISAADGFYIESSTNKDLDLNLNIETPTNIHLLGRLGLLQLGLIENGATGITGHISLDIADGVHTTNIGALITGSSVSIDIEAQAHMQAVLGFDLNFNGSDFTSISSTLPNLRADFVFDWHITNTNLLAGANPTFELNDIALNIGSFITDFLKPITEPINEALNPIRPVIDFLTSPMPVIKDIGPLDDIIKASTKDAAHPDGDDTPLGLAKILTSPAFSAVAGLLGIDLPSQSDIIAAEKFVETLKIFLDIANLAATGSIVLGDFKFYGADLRLSRGSAGGLSSSFDGSLNSGLSSDAATNPNVPDAIKNGLTAGLSLPLLSDPSSIIKLMYGQQIDLFKLTLPDFDFKMEFHLPPIVMIWPVPPIFLDLVGIFEVKTHLVLGYDTRGLTAFSTSHDADDLLKGFYVEDNGVDPLILVSSTLGGGGQAGIPDVVTVSIDAALTADMKFTLAGTIIDHKLYFDNIGDGPGDLGCVFHIEGQTSFSIIARIDTPAKDFWDDLWDAATSVVDAFNDILNTVTFGVAGDLEAALGDFLTSVGDTVSDAVEDLTEALNDAVPGNFLGDLLKQGMMNFWFGPFSYLGNLGDLLTQDGSVPIVGPIPLFGFTIGDCPSDSENPQPPALATLMGDGTLELNVGTDRTQFRHIGENVTDEDYVISEVAPGVVDVTAFGITQRYGDGATHVLSVHGKFDDGNDSLKVVDKPKRDDNTAITFSLDGGNGNDHLEGGWGNDLILGGEGSDDISGGDGNDRLFANNETSQGARLDGANNVVSDHIAGGFGDDQIYGGAGDDILHGGAGIDTLYGGDGNDAMSGDAGDDILYGLLGDDAINGNDGHDLVFGGADRDLLLGGGGDDEIHGDLDTRAITDATALALYGAGNTTENAAWGDYIVGDSLQSLKADFSSAATPADMGARLNAFGLIVNGGDQADGNDIIDGNAGDDLILGNGGNDTISGNDNNDTVFGNAGDDTLFGNAGNDTVSGGAGDDLIFGNAGDDKLAGGADRDIIFGDEGGITRSGGVITVLASLPSGSDGADQITGGVDGDYIFGGGRGDTINGDDPVGGFAGAPNPGTAGNDAIIGDQGFIVFADFAAGKIASVATTDASAADGDVDNLDGNGGDDIVLGGVAGDSIKGGSGRDYLIGDQGAILFSNGLPATVYSTDASGALGGNDTIAGQSGDDIVIGGAGGDNLDTGGNGADVGNDILLGDQGTVVFDATGFAYAIYTSDTAAAQGGNDTIAGGDGDDIALGGIGDDGITGGIGGDILIGDEGMAWFDSATRQLLFAATTDTAAAILGGVDDISGDAGNDILLGGVGGDQLGGGGDNDFIIGDQGVVYFSGGVAAAIVTTDTTPALGGNDTIEGGDGDDVAAGGVGGDGIDGGAGKDMLVGDQGAIIFTGGVVTTVYSTDAGSTLGGVDVMAGGADDDIVIGGAAGDQIDTGGASSDAGNDILIGDQGRVVLTGGPGSFAYFIHTTDTSAGQGGDDTILGGDGNDIAMGGIGADGIGGGIGADLLIGDQGMIWIDPVSGQLSFVTTSDTPALAVLGGIDDITGDAGNDILLGGVAGDQLRGGAGEDVIVGDQGVVYYSGGIISAIVTTDAAVAQGGADTIEGNDDNDIAFGGIGGDDIMGGAGKDLLVGDQGVVIYVGGIPVTIYSTDVDQVLGGADTISGQIGDDIVIGGAAGDQIDTTGVDSDRGSDILIGDQGVVVFTGGATSFAYFINTTDTSAAQGGDDTILGGDGNDIAMGGIGADAITGGVGADILIGDEGQIWIDPVTGLTSYIRSTDTVALAALGGIDDITGEGGNDIVIGGVAGDLLFGGADDDIVIGDQGALYYVGGIIADILTTDEAVVQGGVDRIEGNDGNDTALGGIGADLINGDDPLGGGTALNPGDDVLVGDQGLIHFQNGARVRVVTTDASDLLGGNDTIKGNAKNDIILGGVGSDDLWGGLDNDIILGDEGELLWNLDADFVRGRSDVSFVTLDTGVTTLDRVTTIAPALGAGDVIRGDEGNDIAFGGAGSDLINGDRQGLDAAAQGAGDDILFGDFGKLYPTLGANAAPGSLYFNNFFFSIDTNASARAAADLIFGNGGGDVMIGGQGDDLIDGGNGDDDLIGGHNISGSLGTPFGETAVDELDPLDAAGLAALKAEISLVAGNVTDVTVSLASLDPMVIHPLNDTMLGGEGDDVLVGDNGIVVRKGPNLLTGAPNGDNTDPRFRLAAPTGLETPVGVDISGLLTAAGAPLITTGFTAGVDGAAQDNPYGTLVRTVTVLDQSIDVLQAAIADPNAPRAFGNEVMAGGGGNDLLFAGAGDDVVEGDGNITLNNGSLGVSPVGTLITPTDSQTYNTRVINLATDFQIPAAIPLAGNLPAGLSSLFTVRFVVADTPTDGDDYIEGNAGNDRIYGNGGADDIVGGSAIGYANQGPAIRTDGADLIFGGSDNQALMARNYDDPNALHATDADVIIGDNGIIYRIVTAGGDGGSQPARYNYDNPSFAGYGSNPIVVRAVELQNYGYSYVGSGASARLTFAGIGAGDLIYGEDGDDVVYGGTGNDSMYGNGGDDDLIGGQGADVLLGGTGTDGLIGDDGVVRTARVPDASSIVNEPLNGVTFNAAEINLLITSLDPVTGLVFQQERINLPGTLTKYVSLASYHADDLMAAGMSFDDIIYGGLGTDFIHAGAGNDAVSGAEALPFYYDASGAAGGFTEVNDALVLQQQHGTFLHPTVAPAPFWYQAALYNPGHVLNFNGNWDPATGIFYPLGSKVDEFAYYDELDPRRKIMIDAAGNAVTTAAAAKYDFLLNFNEGEGPQDTRWTNPAADPGSRPTDGDDRIFGDDGNDWLVGATGRDRVYGGRGYDLINMDDNLNSPTDFTLPVPGLNFAPWTGDLENNSIDPYQAYADIAFGGSGSDIYIINTGADRAIDAFGSFDAYWTVFTPFGAPTIDRDSGDGVTDFLEALSKADGADQRMPDGQQYVIDKLAATATPNPSTSRNFEPYGEIGRIIAGDAFDLKEHFNPTDPQPGYISTPSDSSIRELDKAQASQPQRPPAQVRHAIAAAAQSATASLLPTAASSATFAAAMAPASVGAPTAVGGTEASAAGVAPVAIAVAPVAAATTTASGGGRMTDQAPQVLSTASVRVGAIATDVADVTESRTAPPVDMRASDTADVSAGRAVEASATVVVTPPAAPADRQVVPPVTSGKDEFAALAAPMVASDQLATALLLAGLPLVPALAIRPGNASASRWDARRTAAKRAGGLLRFDLASESFDWHDSCGFDLADGDSRMTAGTDPFEEGDDAWLVGMPAPHAAPDLRPGI